MNEPGRCGDQAEADATRSPDGVLRRAEVFEALGDHDTVARCIRIAEQLAASRCDLQALERVHAFADGVASRLALRRFAPSQAWP
jgi:hypothetical protein